MKSSKLLIPSILLALAAATGVRAQLAWSCYDTSGTLVGTAGQAATFNAATGTYTFTVPAGGAYTFVTTNFAPITMTTPASGNTIQTVSYKMSASTGWTNVNASNRMGFIGLFANPNLPSATLPFTNNVGLWGDIKGAGWGDEVFGGTCPNVNLLGEYTSSVKLGSGHTSGTNSSWTLTDGELVDITLRVVATSAGGWELGTSSSWANAGILIQDDADAQANGSAGADFQTIYSSATTAYSAPQTYNEYGFYFYNTSNSISGDTAATATLTLSNFTGLVPPPYFTATTGEPPSSLTTTVGTSTNISCSVPSNAGLGTISYQWQISTDSGATFTNISTGSNASATTATLTLSDPQLTDSGSEYQVIISNTAGSTTSTPCTLTVSSGSVAPSIQTPPQGETVQVGQTISLTVAASGSPLPSYQWYVSTDGGNTYNPVGTNSDILTIADAQLSNTGLYYVDVSNGVSPDAISSAVTVTVEQAPAYSVQPAGSNLAPGADYTLSATVTGTPTPTYQWEVSQNNGTTWADVSGATSANLSLDDVTAATAGWYRLVATNAAATTNSSQVYVGVLSPTMTATAFSPASSGTGVNIDAPISITFSEAVTAGTDGVITIIDATDGNTVVDTLDLSTAFVGVYSSAAPVYLPGNVPILTENIGGVTNGGAFSYYPILVNGNTATIYPNVRLAYGKTYYVNVTPNVFLGSDGTFAGISDDTTWTFSTKSAATATSASSTIMVAADGSGDFNTVQGALDTANGTSPVTIYVANGSYTEMDLVYGKNNITLFGESRTGAVIQYPNNNNFNASDTSTHGNYERGVFETVNCDNFTVANLTINNTTPHGGTQAEALILDGNATSTTTPGEPSTAEAIVTGVTLNSYQDTLQINGQAYVSDSHISGDVDFMWGTGPVSFYNCELTALTTQAYYNQVRNGPYGNGFVYVDCTLDASATSTGSSNPVTGCYLGRTDQTTGNGYPWTDVVYIDCALGTHILPVGWLLNGESSAPDVFLAEYNSTQLGTGAPGAGTPVDVSERASFSTQITNPTTVSNDENPYIWLGSNWTPAMAPVIVTEPVGTSVGQGGTATFTVTALGVSEPTYQWSLNSTPLSDGTQGDGSVVSGSATATLTITGAALDENGGSYTVVATNPTSSATSSAASLTVTPGAPTLTGVVSSMVHGSAGTFGIPIAYTSNSSAPSTPYPVEGRASSSLSIVLTFNEDISSAQASLGSGTGSVGTPVCSGTTVTVPVTGVANAQTLIISLSDITASDGGVLANATVALRVLQGDVSGDGVVNITDINLAREFSGQSVNSSNFQYDINADGSIDISDVNLVRAASGTVAN